MNPGSDDFLDEYDETTKSIDGGLTSHKSRFREHIRSFKKKKRIRPPSADPENEDLEQLKKQPANSLQYSRRLLRNNRNKCKRSNASYRQILNKLDEKKQINKPRSDEEDGETFSDEYSCKDDRRSSTRFLLEKNGAVEITLLATIFLSAVFLVIFISVNKHRPLDNNFSMFPGIPVDNLDELCDVSNVSTSRGYGECEKACQSARCCLESGDKSCFLEEEDICGLYSPCGILHNEVEGNDDEDTQDALVDNIIPLPPKNIDEICSDYSLEGIEGYVACDTACSSARCCFDEYTSESDEIQSCKDSHHQLCRLYDSCQLLNEVYKKAGSIQDTVSKKCDKSYVNQNNGNKKECEDICRPRSCCFSQVNNCRSKRKEWCEEFQPCEVLFNLDSHENSFEIQAQVGIPDQCENFNTLTTDDLKTCIKSCSKALCCMYDDTECEHINCNKYKYCEAIDSADVTKTAQALNGIDQPKKEDLIDDRSPFVTPADLACSDITNKKGRDDCIFVCKDTKCCFDESKNGCMNNKACKHYYACRKVVYYLS